MKSLLVTRLKTPLGSKRPNRTTARRQGTLADVPLSGKVAVFAFLFFLIKGLLWLLIPALIFAWGC
jgi:hypothetical protein